MPALELPRRGNWVMGWSPRPAGYVAGVHDGRKTLKAGLVVIGLYFTAKHPIGPLPWAGLSSYAQHMGLVKRKIAMKVHERRTSFAPSSVVPTRKSSYQKAIANWRRFCYPLAPRHWDTGITPNPLPTCRPRTLPAHSGVSPPSSAPALTAGLDSSGPGA
jgi:hypothetical protein